MVIAIDFENCYGTIASVIKVQGYIVVLEIEETKGNCYGAIVVLEIDI